jgi:hypothetical protein
MTAAPVGPIDLHALWCDDIRHEIGNKPSFMGVYTSALGVPQLPLALPKLCCWLTLTAPPELPLTALTVTINLDDGTELLRVPLPTEGTADQASQPTDAPATLATTARQQVMVAMEIAPLTLPAGAAALTVALSAQGEELASASLPVLVQQPAAA